MSDRKPPLMTYLGAQPKIIQRQFKESDLVTASTGSTVAFNVNVLAGNLIIVRVAQHGVSNRAISSIIDSLGNTYIHAHRTGVAGTNSQIDIYYAKNITGGACTLTFNWINGTDSKDILIEEISGCDTVSPLDTNDGIVETTGTSHNSTTSPQTTSANGSYIVTASSLSGSNTGCTPGAGYLQQTSTNSVIIFMVENAVGSVAATRAAFTITNSRTNSAAFASFKAPNNAPITIAGTGGSISEFAISEVPISGSPSTPGAPTGTLSVTENKDTMSASALETFTGAFSATEALDVMSASALETFTGAFSATEALDVMSASALETFTGAFSATEALDVMGATGNSGNDVDAAFAATEALDAMGAIGTVSALGSLSIVEAADSMGAGGAIANPVSKNLTQGVYPWLNPDGSPRVREKPYVKDTHKAEEQAKEDFRKMVRAVLAPYKVADAIPSPVIAIEGKNKITSKTLVLKKKEEIDNYELEYLLLLAA